HSQFHVSSISCVIVNSARGIQHSAVAVVGELIEAGVGHQHGVIAEILGQIPQRDVEDAVLGNSDRAGGVLVLFARDAEQHQSADAGSHRVGGRPAQRVAGVLYHARHRGDITRLVDAV